MKSWGCVVPTLLSWTIRSARICQTAPQVRRSRHRQFGELEGRSMEKINQCIFCDKALDGNTKPEHILLNALGGRKTTSKVICSDCNNRFGGTIDDALAKQVPV